MGTDTATCSECGQPLADGRTCPRCMATATPTPAPGSAGAATRRIAATEIPEACRGVTGGFGRYEIHGELGRGGMGRVLAAVDRELGRAVALKVISARGLPAEVCRRFLVEAQITSQLEHPNIIPVYDGGITPTGDLYYTMKLVRGRSLKAILDDGSTPPSRLLGIFTDVANAVAFAHARGVVHRDLKPENVMVGSFGEVLVMDWGLARLDRSGEGPRDGEAASPDPLATQAGEVLGTPAYMAPEQALGAVDRVDARTDVYALGAMLFRLLAGHSPIRAASAREAIDRAGRGDVEPLPSGVSEELAAIVRRAMAFERDERYPTAEALAADVTAFLEGRTVAAATYGPWRLLAKWVARNRRFAAAVAGATLALVAGMGVTAIWLPMREARRLHDEAMARAREALHGVPPADELRAERDPDRPESPDEAQRREDALGAYLTAAAEISRALGHRSSEEAVRERIRVGRELVEVAILGGDYTLARRAALDLDAFGLRPGEVDALIARVDEARFAELRRRRARLQAAIGDIGGGLDRPDRSPGSPSLEDYVIEAAGYRDAQTVEVLGAALSSLSGTGPAVREAPFSMAEKDLAAFACRVLGRVDLAAAVEPLASFVRAIHDEELLAEAGIALCHTRRTEALTPLLDLRDRLGEARETWQRIEREIARIPEPASEPRTAAEFIRRGLRRLLARRYVLAVEDCSRALDLDPANPSAFHDRAYARKAIGDLAGAFDDYTRAIECDPSHAISLNGRGVVRLRRGDIPGAIEDLSRAIALDERYVMAYSNRALARFRQGDVRGTIEDCNRAIEIDPRYADAYVNRAAALQRLGDLDGAIEDLGRALAIDPLHAGAHANRGNIRLRQGDIDGAVGDCTRAIEIDPREPAAYCGRSLARYRQGDFPGALEDAARAIEIDPSLADAWNNRGLVLLRTGEIPRAIEDLTRALDLAPESAMTWFNRAAAYYLSRDWERARADAERFLELDPDSESAPAARRIVEESRAQEGGGR